MRSRARVERSAWNESRGRSSAAGRDSTGLWKPAGKCVLLAEDEEEQSVSEVRRVRRAIAWLF